MRKQHNTLIEIERQQQLAHLTHRRERHELWQCVATDQKRIPNRNALTTAKKKKNKISSTITRQQHQTTLNLIQRQYMREQCQEPWNCVEIGMKANRLQMHRQFWIVIGQQLTKQQQCFL
jgi:hypothetical protein